MSVMKDISPNLLHVGQLMVMNTLTLANGRLRYARSSLLQALSMTNLIHSNVMQWKPALQEERGSKEMVLLADFTSSVYLII